MKTVIKYCLLGCLILLLPACEDYLTHYLKDQISLEETFQTRNGVENYLANVYSFLPRDYDQGSNDTPVTTSRSDEAYFSWTTWVSYLNYNNGSWTPESKPYHTWEKYYKGINQASIFIENIDNCPNSKIGALEKDQMKAEARFLRAFYYFLLMQQYGPVYVWGDKLPDDNIDPSTVDRQPLDSCIYFINSEMEKAAAVLPYTTSGDDWLGRVTKGAVKAARSRMWLYAARPLFNGCPWYKGMTNYYGQYLFPQTADPKKWRKAAEAAYEVINMSSNGSTALYKLTSSDGTDPIVRGNTAYANIFFVPWNTEIIFGRWEGDGANWLRRTLPPEIGLNDAYGGYTPSLKLVDTYPMQATGRFPIIGYERDGKPIIDPLSGYVEDGFTENYVHPYDGPKLGSIKAHNSCVGRDCRFYTSIFFGGMYWINTKFVENQRSQGKEGGLPVTFHIDGTSSYANSTGDYVKTGYLFRRLTNRDTDTQSGVWGNFSWPYFRLTEMYLNYAEAWIMMDPADRAALTGASYKSGIEFWNDIRKRVSLNTIQEAYPEINFNDFSAANQKRMIDLLLKERMVEMAYENQRYYDVRMWMMGEKESNGPRYGRNLLASTYEASWERTDKICLPIVCEKKHHLFPIQQNQLNEMKHITQNYGW